MKLPKIAWLAILGVLLAAAPALAQSYPVYDNGPINGTTDAWTINMGYIVSDTFYFGGGSFRGFAFGVWELPGDTLNSVQWSITSGENGGTVYGSGITYNVAPCVLCASGNLTDKFISTNQYGYDIDLITATGMYIPLTNGARYWLNLSNASAPSGDPIYWDENSGFGCSGSGCPSQASESTVGTIASEAFTIYGGEEGGARGPSGPTPEPSSIMLFGSGILGLVEVLRRKLR